MLWSEGIGCGWELWSHLQMIISSLVHLLSTLEALSPERLLCCFVTVCAIYAGEGVVKKAFKLLKEHFLLKIPGIAHATCPK